MKTFRYTCRDKDGRLKKGSLQAADRAEAFSRLRWDGLVPVSVEVSDRPLAGGNGAGVWRRAALPWALLAVAVALAGLWWYHRPAEKSVKPVASADGPRATAARTARTGNAEKGVADIQETGAAKETPDVPLPLPEDEPPARVDDGLGTGGVTDAVAEPTPIRGAQRRLAEAVARGERVTPLFKRESENILAIHSELGHGAIPHPIPDNFEEDMRKALAEDIVITGEDTPEDERRKELVAWMKEDMRRHIAGGGTALGYMDVLRERQERGAELYSQARDILDGFMRDGGTDEALAAHRALNEELAAAGVVPLPLPARIRRELKAKGVEYAE